jgi:flagellar hook-basal body complex protein FliE
MYLNFDQVSGHIVKLQTSDPRHLAGAPGVKPSSTSGEGSVQSFGKLFSEALGKVNEEQIRSMKLDQQMLTDPDSVNVHDVTIAMAQANLSLSMTKAITDGVIRAYKELMAIR